MPEAEHALSPFLRDLGAPKVTSFPQRDGLTLQKTVAEAPPSEWPTT